MPRRPEKRTRRAEARAPETPRRRSLVDGLAARGRLGRLLLLGRGLGLARHGLALLLGEELRVRGARDLEDGPQLLAAAGRAVGLRARLGARRGATAGAASRLVDVLGALARLLLDGPAVRLHPGLEAGLVRELARGLLLLGRGLALVLLGLLGLADVGGAPRRAGRRPARPPALAAARVEAGRSRRGRRGPAPSSRPWARRPSTSACRRRRAPSTSRRPSS